MLTLMLYGWFTVSGIASNGFAYNYTLTRDQIVVSYTTHNRLPISIGSTLQLSTKVQCMYIDNGAKIACVADRLVD